MLGVRRLHQQGTGPAALSVAKLVVVVATALPPHRRRAAKLTVLFHVLTKSKVTHSPLQQTQVVLWTTSAAKR